VFQLPVEAAYLYDAVWLYARAAHELIVQGHDPSDGQRILDRITGTTYKSMYSATDSAVGRYGVVRVDLYSSSLRHSVTRMLFPDNVQTTSVVTSAREVMFSLCLLVCL